MTDSSRVRVTIVGVVCVALFSALFARLWFLQLASDETFAAAATANSTRVVQTEAPRGRILDRDGAVLVENRRAVVVTASRELEGEELDRALGQLAELLASHGVTVGVGAQAHPIEVEDLEARYEDPRASKFKPAVLAVDVPESVLVVLTEQAAKYPGISVDELPVRSYPNGAYAAHLLGYVGEIDPDELRDLESEGYALGDTIGRAGVEAAYEEALRGEPATDVVEVDPTNRVVDDEPLESTPAVPGHDVHLTLDLDVQQVAEDSLAEAITQAREHRNPDVDERVEDFAAPGGAVVALDATDGSVVAMASHPTFPVDRFIGGISNDLWEQLNDPEGPYGVEPLNNRATLGQYAPGSTFKLVTALAALQTGLRTVSEPYEDPGLIDIGGTTFRNAGGRNYGVVDLPLAVAYSVDTYFYEIGRRLWQAWNDPEAHPYDGEAIQQVARQFGFGSATGVPLAEEGGRVPDAAWQQRFAELLYDPEDPAESEQLREASRWRPGFNVNLAIGQGDMLGTPLQLANAYATFANGGTRWEPRVADRVVDTDGETVRRISASEAGRVEIDPAHRDALMSGFQGALTLEQGTAAGTFASWPHDRIPVAGKTGTAQVDDKGDTSLFVGMVPADDPQYVVAAVVEQAGFGSRVAAPVVRRVLEELMDVPPTPIEIPPQQGGVD